MTAEETRLLLLTQHERLRQQVSHCTRVATLYRAGLATASELDLALDGLREEFAVHNETETRVIQKLLHGPAAWGSLMIDRMFEEHVAEHSAFWDLLQGTTGQVAMKIDELEEELDAHMAAEERTFLAPVTLRDDVIRVRMREESKD